MAAPLLNGEVPYRYRSARRKGASLCVRTITIEEIMARRSELQNLLNNVLSRRRFLLIEESIDFYLQCAQKLGAHFHFRVYEQQTKIVGFATAIEQNDTLIAHRVGIDYANNASHKLYQNILYDYIDQAITLRKKRLSFGRTALEIKSAVGARPQSLNIFIKHPLWLTNLFLRYALHSIATPQWIWRNALQNPATATGDVLPQKTAAIRSSEVIVKS